MIYEQEKDNTIPSSLIQKEIDIWDTKYTNSKPNAIEGILEMVKVSFCDNEDIILSEASHLVKQLDRKLFKGDLSGCMNPIRKSYLNEDTDRNKEYNRLLDSLSESYHYQSRNVATQSNLVQLDEKYGIQEMYNKSGAFRHKTYSKYAIDKLCNIISESYRDRMSNDKIITICMEANKKIFDACPGIISREDILQNISEFFMVKDGYSIDDINKAICELKLYSDKEVVSIEESMDNLVQVIQLHESDGSGDILNTSSSEYKNMMRSKRGSVKRAMEDLISSYNKSKDQYARNNRAACNRADKHLYKILRPLYGTPTRTIINDIPDIFGIIRKVITYGLATAIGPFTGVLAMVVDMLITANTDMNYIPDVIKSLERERNIVKDTLSDKKSDLPEENREVLEMHLKDIEDQIEKLEAHIGMYKELDSKYMIEEFHDDNYNRNIGAVMAISEAMFGTDEIVLTENVVKNTMRKAKEKLRSTTEKLSAAEKNASRKLDNSIDRFTESFEKAMSLDNREKVIKGDVLPNASKVIKLAIATGTAWAMSPALAVIGALSSWSLSKKVRKRERQIVLDEIGVHLRIVEKKIQQAEMNNDIEAVEQLMLLEGKLKREEQRIKYRQRAYK